MELLVLLLVVIAAAAVLILLARTTTLLVGLAVNTIVGLILLFLTNLVVSPPIPINIITLLICAIGGVGGWLIILILHILRIAF